MKASITSRITCSVLAATLTALPCNEALAAAPAAAPAAQPAAEEVPSDEPPTEVAAPEGEPAEGEVPLEPEAPPVEEEAAPPPPPEPQGPERPPEPTVANGKYKAKGNGLMISGGVLLGLGAAGLISSILLTRCDEPANTFSCKNKQHNTFAVPATAAATLLGAVLLFVGVGYRLRYKRWENWKPEDAPKTAVYPTMLRGGAGVGYSLRF